MMYRYFVALMMLLATPIALLAADGVKSIDHKRSSESCCKCIKKQQKKERTKCHKNSCCCIDSSVAKVKYTEDCRNPVAGKNVLIIGASKGMGNGAAQIFTNAGANVIGTSRFPSDYSGQPWLSPIPIDITVDSSVENFFATEPTLATWDHIDILILSGNVPPWGSLMYLKASDLFPNA